MSNISGSKCTATANANRTYIPLEYRLTGVPWYHITVIILRRM